MKTSKSSGTFRPFENLEELLKKKSLNPLPDCADEHTKGRSKTCSKQNNTDRSENNTEDNSVIENELELFLEAMADVKPIFGRNRVAHHFRPPPPVYGSDRSENETLQRLNSLIETGEGFVVKNTPEYIEGTGYNVHPEIPTRLHRGDFSIQATIDLHGLGVEDARNTFEIFLKDSITTGKRAVLVIHGRGLSSPDRPVLKTKVVEWLTRGPWRKWIIAFSSARTCDGGAGATYILLRQRPMTRRHRKRTKEH